ncbi:hypothetical protein BE15_19600 [Sorangium cellulosum]|uniref:PPM-type phosphatase domain-containing protein n=1 Tax=Sorangium cellulosum TaxID=56 RepID=A0A150QP37_SORCE|nr:hypothetical protein BE15_19600 [Sorangium cellulosum]
MPCLGLFLVTGGVDEEAACRTAIQTVVGRFDAVHASDARHDEAPSPQEHDEVRLLTSMRRAHLGRHDGAARDAGQPSASPSLAGVLLAPGAVYAAYAGGWRVYRLRGGKLEQRAPGVGPLDELACAGGCSADAQATLAQHATTAARALGCEAAVEMTAQIESTAPGDLFIVCSQELWRAVPEHRMAGILAAHRDLRLAASLLTDCAWENGEPQRVTCVLARAGGSATAARACGKPQCGQRGL